MALNNQEWHEMSCEAENWLVAYARENAPPGWEITRTSSELGRLGIEDKYHAIDSYKGDVLAFRRDSHLFSITFEVIASTYNTTFTINKSKMQNSTADIFFVQFNNNERIFFSLHQFRILFGYKIHSTEYSYDIYRLLKEKDGLLYIHLRDNSAIKLRVYHNKDMVKHVFCNPEESLSYGINR